MSITVPLTLTSQTIAPFHRAWQDASEQADTLSAALLERCMQVDFERVPTSLKAHIEKVKSIALLLTDKHWMVDAATRQGLGGALLYFDKSDDMIPDSDPQFGLLDDAIVIEIALAEHREVWAAWQEYRLFSHRHSALGEISGDEWLALRNAAARTREESFLEPHYARSDQRSRYQKLPALPRLDLH